MKKLALLFAMVFSTSIILSVHSFAVALPIRVVVNGTKITFPDAQPFVDSNARTQTPARFIGEALGATASWDGKSKKATFEKRGKKLILYIGKKEYDIDGQKKQMDTVALLKDSRTFVPARYVAEAFGATVSWKDSIKTVYIDTSKAPQPTSGGTENIGGFIVPKGIDLGVIDQKNDDTFDLYINIDFLRNNVEKQKNDTENILIQRFSNETVKQVMDYIRPKVDPNYVLQQKVIYDKSTNQYIVIQRSISDTITIWISLKGVKPNV